MTVKDLGGALGSGAVLDSVLSAEPKKPQAEATAKKDSSISVLRAGQKGEKIDNIGQ
jgi:hypothetical protein